MDLGRLDLNLLVPLDALLRERSVTRAAQRLGLSQPALSASLRRLRRHFDDELLVRRGNSYVLSPFASQLRHRLAGALDSIGDVFSEHPSFDPGTSTREYRILASDYVISIIGGALATALAEVAPSARLRLTRWDLTTALMTGDWLSDETEGLILPHGFVSDMPYIDLFSDTWSGLVAADNPAVGETLTAEGAQSMSWVVAYREARSTTAAEQTLRLQGVELTTTVVVDSFLALPHMVAGSDRIALVETRLAERACAQGGVRMVRLPQPAGQLIEAFWWHPSRTDDAEHSWLRGMLQDAAACLLPVER